MNIYQSIIWISDVHAHVRVDLHHQQKDGDAEPKGRWRTQLTDVVDQGVVSKKEIIDYHVDRRLNVPYQYIALVKQIQYFDHTVLLNHQEVSNIYLLNSLFVVFQLEKGLA